MATQNTDAIDISVIIRKVRSKWYWFALCTVLAVSAAIAYIKVTPKSYLVGSVILMSEEKRNSFGGANEEFLKGTSYLSSGGELEDQISLLMSFDNVRRTVKKLDLTISYLEEKNFKVSESYVYKPFIVRLDTALQVTGLRIQVIPDVSSGTYRVKAKGKNIQLYDLATEQLSDGFIPELDIDQEVKVGEPFQSEHLSFRIDFIPEHDYPKDKKYYFYINTVDGLTTHFRNKISAEAQGDQSNIVLLTSQGEVVQKEVDVLNALMATYIETEQEKHDVKGNRTIEFIDSQLGESQKVLTEAEGELQGAQLGGGALVGSAGDRGQAIFSEISRLQDDQSRLQGQMQYLSLLISKMSAEDAGNPSTIAASNVDAPALSNLIDQYNRDVSELSQKRLTERIQSPATIALTRKVQTERNQIIQTAQDAQRASQLQLEQLNSRIGQLNYQMNQLPSSSRKVAIATRKYALSEEIHNYLMEKRYEAQIAVNSDQIDKYVVDKARQVGLGPVSPNKKVLLGGALLLGILLPLGGILLVDMFDDRIDDLEELKRVSPLPVLCTIPASKKKRISPEEPKSLLAEAFRTARINLQYLNVASSRHVIGVTSSTSGEGKTFCAVNMATIYAISGRRTLIIDADMRRPKVAGILGLENDNGLSNYLVGEVDLRSVIKKTDVEGLDVITSGPIPPNPLELVEMPRMAQMFTELKGQYDRIIVDASPMGLVSEFVILIQHIDVTLYVVRRGMTRKKMLEFINENYREGRFTNMNLLLNDVRHSSGGTGGYGYYS